ncbi:MAG: hypothetical protein WCG27_04540, partial [Pseudomonadota bacterium]
FSRYATVLGYRYYSPFKSYPAHVSMALNQNNNQEGLTTIVFNKNRIFNGNENALFAYEYRPYGVLSQPIFKWIINLKQVDREKTSLEFISR